MRRLHAVLLAVLLLPAASPPEEFLGVKEWWGSFTITIRGEATDSGKHETRTLRIHRRATGDLHLYQRSNAGMVPGRQPSLEDVEVNRHRTWMQPPDKKLQLPPVIVDVDDSYSADGTLPVEGNVVDKTGTRTTWTGHDTVRLILGDFPMLIVDVKKKLYHLVLPFKTINSLPVTERHREWIEFWNNNPRQEQSNVTTRTGAELPAIDKKINPSWILDQPLPDSAKVLQGMVTYDAPIKGFKGAKQFVDIHWNLVPSPPEPVELILEPEKAYQEWRPKASLTESVAGARINVKATLQKKGGGEPGERAKKITFTMTKVSREPGIAINYPENPKTDYDLKFEPGQNTRFKSESDLSISLEQTGLKQATAVVSSFDYGAFGILQASAVLEGGREIQGELVKDPGRWSIRIPKSADGSWIADSWKLKANATGADDADDDNDPVGDGNKGDGLTLYEEYRGYIQKGYWSWSDPNRKDFFIFDGIGGKSKSGIRMFKAATGLEIHDRLTSREAGRKGVINCNFAEGAHRVDQHWVMLTSFDETGYAIAVGGPGTPKNIEYIRMPFFAVVKKEHQEKYQTYWERTLAHELGHTCNVYHHGDKDTDEVWMVDQDSDGAWKTWRTKLRPGAAPENGDSYERAGVPVIRLYEEPRNLITPSPGRRLVRVTIGETHGQHSGFEACLMRYDCADVYRKDKNNEFYWVSGKEVIADTLCNAVDGVTVNKDPRDPKSRYGKADAKRGKCLSQICVNDGAKPERRGPQEERKK